MILRVDFMKDFGIFKNFNWSSIPDIEDFKEKNIIYGWNYCGKTTFSRLFCCLRDKVRPSAHLNSKFKLTYDKGYIDDYYSIFMARWGIDCIKL